MKTLLLIIALLLSACGKQSQNTNICPSLKGATCTQEAGFVDVSICGVDVHLVNNVTYVCGGCTTVSQTDNSQYSPASNGTFNFPQGGPQGPVCSFTVTNGTLSN